MGLFLFCQVRFGGLGLFFVLVRRNLSFPFATLQAAALSPQQCSSGLVFAEGLINLSLLLCQGQTDGRCCKHERTHPRGGSKASESEGAALRVKRHFQICAGALGWLGIGVHVSVCASARCSSPWPLARPWRLGTLLNSWSSTCARMLSP